MFGIKKIYGVLNDYFWDKSFIVNLLLIVIFFVVLNLIIFLRFMDPNNLFLISLLKGDKIIEKQVIEKQEKKPTFLKINNSDNSFEVLNFKKEDFINQDNKKNNNRRMMSNLLL